MPQAISVIKKELAVDNTNTVTSVKKSDNKSGSQAGSIFENEGKKETNNKQISKLSLEYGVLLTPVFLLGVGIGTFVAGGLLNRKLSFLKPLAQHIDFKPAKTLKEAIEFAKTHLGIKKYKINDLDIANLINEGLVSASNRCKGKIFMPDAIKYGHFGDVKMSAVTFFGKRTLRINKRYYKEYCSRPKFSDAAECFGISDAKISLKELLKDVGVPIKPPVLKPSGYENPFLDLYHELGHMQRTAYLPDRYLRSMYEQGFDGIKGKLAREFLRNPEKQRIAGLVSNYAKTAPEEFCAEVYSLLIDNTKKIPQEVLDLYKSYGGALIA